MWLATCFGFFSVVRRDNDAREGMLTVRGRVRADLEAFRSGYLPGASPVMEQERADYRYRFRVPEADMARAFERILREIDYGDFKTAVEARQGWVRHDIYEQVGSVMRQLYCCDQPAEKEEAAV